MSKIIKYFNLHKTDYEGDNLVELKNNSIFLNKKKKNIQYIFKDIFKIFNFLNLNKPSVICETYLPFFLEKKTSN